MRSAKFWEIAAAGKQVWVRYGRLGSGGQSQSKSFPDAAAATKQVEKLIAEKTAKGYVECVVRKAVLSLLSGRLVNRRPGFRRRGGGRFPFPRSLSMTQAEMERELSRTTGESVCTIRNRGFSLMMMPDRDPLTIDWDDVQEREPLRYAPRRRPVRWRLAA